MKNYNRRGLIIGIVQLLLSVFCFITMIVTGFDVKLAVLGIIIALLGITSVINSFSKEETRKELIDNEDERSQLVKMKAKAKSFDIASNFLFLATIAVMIAYGITKNHVFVYMVLCTGAALSVCWISHIIAHFYYESKN
ncbi:MAG: DUF2178 domain-containing protein [Lachnospiraceae bacterium]